MTSVTIQGTVYEIPDSRESPAWGEELHDFCVAVATALASVTATGDIAVSSATLTDNISSATNVTGLAFSTSSVRAAIIDYSVIRNSVAEAGIMAIAYNGTSWTLIRSASADTGITFTVTNAGQFQYTSTSTGFNGTMKYRARALPI